MVNADSRYRVSQLRNECTLQQWFLMVLHIATSCNAVGVDLYADFGCCIEYTRSYTLVRSFRLLYGLLNKIITDVVEFNIRNL